jgi:hypothetical protein
MPLPRCESCGFLFDPKDPRAQAPGKWGQRCPLCEAMRQGVHRSLAFAMRNDCQGLFDDVFSSPAAAAEKWDREDPDWRNWRNANGEPDGRIVPVVLLQVPDDHEEAFYARCEGEDRDASRHRWRDEERQRVVAAIAARAAA